MCLSQVEVLGRMRSYDGGGGGADHGVLAEAHRLMDDGSLVHRHDSSTLHLQYWHRGQSRDHVTHPHTETADKQNGVKSLHLNSCHLSASATVFLDL